MCSFCLSSLLCVQVLLQHMMCSHTAFLLPSKAGVIATKARKCQWRKGCLHVKDRHSSHCEQVSVCSEGWAVRLSCSVGCVTT